MADMVDCGESCFNRWRRGCLHSARFLGPFDPTMTAAEAIRRLEFDKLNIDARQRFARGWDRAKAECAPAQGDLYA